MAKILITNGCSMTIGEECADPVREAWPAVLGNLLGLPMVNLACEGGSNRRIVRTTASNVDRACREAGVDVADALVICMWTGPDRSEHFRPHEPDRRKHTIARPRLPYEDNWFRIGQWRIDDDKPTSMYYRHLSDDTGTTVGWLLDWLLLDGYLRSRGAVARYAFAWHVFALAGRKPAGEVQDLMGQLDPATVYGGQVWSQGTSFQDINVRGGYRFGPEGHPLAEAHANFAGLLAGWLTETGAA